MKKINKCLLLILLSCLFININNAQTVSITSQSLTSADIGTVVTFSVNASGIYANYGNVLTATISITYNPAVFTYVGYANLSPSIGSNLISVNPAGTGGVVQFNMLNYSGFDYPDGKSFDLHLTYNGGSSALTITLAEFLDSGFNTDDATVTNGTASGPSVSLVGGGNWSQAATWLGSNVPDPSYPVIINSAPATPVVMDVSSSVTGDFTINSGGALTINSGKTLTVSGNFIINSDATGTGSFINNGSYTAATTTVEKYLPAWPSTTSSQGWHMISSPIAGSDVTDFSNFTPSPATTYDFFKWDEPTVQWINQKTPANNITSFVSGVGYMVSYQNAGTHNFTGTLNTSDVSPTITYTVQSPVNTTGQGWNLIGNPFTSAIDATNITSWTKSNVNNYVAVYDDNSAIYRYWNGTVGNLTNNIIPAMQAFWVKSNSASPSVTIPAANRVHNAQNLYKSEVENVVDLSVTSQNGFSDEAFVYFSNSATNEFDESTDVPKLAGPVQQAPELYSYIGSDKFAINAMGPHISAAIPLGFVPGINGTFTLKANDLNSFSANNVITLQDLKTGINQNLMQNNTYTFTASTTDNVNRFILNFNSALGIGEITANTPSKIYSYDNTIFVNCTEVVKQISIYNTIGQLIYTVDNPTGLVKYSLSGNNTTGYYIVRVISDKNVNSEKVFVK